MPGIALVQRKERRGISPPSIENHHNDNNLPRFLVEIK